MKLKPDDLQAELASNLARRRVPRTIGPGPVRSHQGSAYLQLNVSKRRCRWSRKYQAGKISTCACKRAQSCASQTCRGPRHHRLLSTSGSQDLSEAVVGTMLRLASSVRSSGNGRTLRFRLCGGCFNDNVARQTGAWRVADASPSPMTVAVQRRLRSRSVKRYRARSKHFIRGCSTGRCAWPAKRRGFVGGIPTRYDLHDLVRHDCAGRFRQGTARLGGFFFEQGCRRDRRCKPTTAWCGAFCTSPRAPTLRDVRL
eukprot:s1126_g4.t1